MTETLERTELCGADCLRLLAGAVVGRVVFTDAALPAAHPVTYVLDREEVVFGAAAGGRLVAAVLHRIVAFQVDEIDLEARTGWSVLGVGKAYEVTDPERLAACRTRMPPSWAYDRDGRTIAIPLQRLTGRRLSGPMCTPTPSGG
jgi:nitroimidazol reductase NimA-like FMN-containing flavoprotein (pyridoxamine 5'-phosphate oxidase superfamily)